MTQALSEKDENVGGGFGLTVCGEALQEVMEAKGVRGPQDLAQLFAEADYEMDADAIAVQMTGEEEVDPTFPGFFAGLLRLNDAEEQKLARGVIHGQYVCRIGR